MPESKDQKSSAIEVAALALQKAKLREMYALAEDEKKKNQFTVKNSEKTEQKFIATVKFNDDSSSSGDEGGEGSATDDSSDKGPPDSDDAPKTYTVTVSSEVSTAAASSTSTASTPSSCQFTVTQPTRDSHNGRIVVKCDNGGGIDAKTALRLQLMVVFRHLAESQDPVTEIHFHQFSGLPNGVEYVDPSNFSEVGIDASVAVIEPHFLIKGEMLDAGQFIQETLTSFKHKDSLGRKMQGEGSLPVVFMPGEKKIATTPEIEAEVESSQLGTLKTWLANVLKLVAIAAAVTSSETASNDRPVLSPFMGKFKAFIETVSSHDEKAIDEKAIAKKIETFLKEVKVNDLTSDDIAFIQNVSESATGSCAALLNGAYASTSEEPQCPQLIAEEFSTWLEDQKEVVTKQLKAATPPNSGDAKGDATAVNATDKSKSPITQEKSDALNETIKTEEKHGVSVEGATAQLVVKQQNMSLPPNINTTLGLLLNPSSTKKLSVWGNYPEGSSSKKLEVGGPCSRYVLNPKSPIFYGNALPNSIGCYPDGDGLVFCIKETEGYPYGNSRLPVDTNIGVPVLGQFCDSNANALSIYTNDNRQLTSSVDPLAQLALVMCVFAKTKVALSCARMVALPFCLITQLFLSLNQSNYLPGPAKLVQSDTTFQTSSLDTNEVVGEEDRNSSQKPAVDSTGYNDIRFFGLPLMTEVELANALSFWGLPGNDV